MSARRETGRSDSLANVDFGPAAEGPSSPSLENARSISTGLFPCGPTKLLGRCTDNRTGIDMYRWLPAAGIRGRRLDSTDTIVTQRTGISRRGRIPT